MIVELIGRRLVRIGRGLELDGRLRLVADGLAHAGQRRGGVEEAAHAGREWAVKAVGQLVVQGRKAVDGIGWQDAGWKSASLADGRQVIGPRLPDQV